MSAVVSFDAIKATAEAALEIAKTIKVTDADSAAFATAKGAELKVIGDRAESIRQDLVKPIDEAREKIQADAKAIINPVKAARADLNGKVIAWQEEEKAKAQAIADAEKVAAEARLSDVMSDDNATIEEVEKVAEHVAIASKPVKMSGSYKPLKTRENWKYNLIDFEAFVKWCIETKQLRFLAVDGAEFGARVRASAENNPIRRAPGMEIFSEVGVG